MLVYVEYRSRKQDVDLEIFHTLVGQRTNAWADQYPEDILVLNAGRTWRLGPEPEYLVVYYTPDSGLERFTEWERIFVSGEAAALEAQTRATGRLDAAGCYVPLTTPVPAQGGRYYAEFFDIAEGRSREEVGAFFLARQAAHGDITLHLAVDRIGGLGPDPRGFAIWGIPGYHSLERIAEELADTDDPIRMIRAGLYADIGEEII
jgi:hypothetical protein